MYALKLGWVNPFKRPLLHWWRVAPKPRLKKSFRNFVLYGRDPLFPSPPLGGWTTRSEEIDRTGMQGSKFRWQTDRHTGVSLSREKAFYRYIFSLSVSRVWRRFCSNNAQKFRGWRQTHSSSFSCLLEDGSHNKRGQKRRGEIYLPFFFPLLLHFVWVEEKKPFPWPRGQPFPALFNRSKLFKKDFTKDPAKPLLAFLNRFLLVCVPLP